MKIHIPTSILYKDNVIKELWNKIGKQVDQNNQVIIKITGVNIALDYSSLSPREQDSNGNPTFGIGNETKMNMLLTIEVSDSYFEGLMGMGTVPVGTTVLKKE